MSFWKILESGAQIRIEAGKNDGYLPARFWLRGGKLVSWGPAFGTMLRDDMGPKAFNTHVSRMIDEQFRVVIEKGVA